MNWLVTSAITSLIVTGGPLVMAESARRASALRSEDLRVRRCRLHVATGVAWIAFALWFVRDQAAIGAGQRPLAVVLACLLAFTVLLFGFALPVIGSLRALSPAAAWRQLSAEETSAIPPTFLALRRAHLAGAVAIVVVLLAFAIGRNAAGYQIKSAVILLSAVGLYAVEVEALRQARPTRSVLGTSSLRGTVLIFFGFIAAALLTLLLDWSVAWQRWLGVGSQWAVGIVGFTQCAGSLMGPAPRPPSRRGGRR